MKSFILSVLLFLSSTYLYTQSLSESRIETKIMKSTVLGTDREYTVFLPKGYDTDTDRKHPVLYLLHGMMQTNQDWYHRGHLKEVMDRLTSSGEACDMIIVTPNAGGNMDNGHWNGYFDMPGWKYETFFFTEFLPHIESAYRITGNKQSRAIAGLSMGGGGATAYGLKHSEIFGAVYAMSALMSIPEQGAHRFDNSDSLMAILTRSVIENCCIKYVEEADETLKNQLRSVMWFIDCGDDDFLLDRNIEFFQSMRKASIPCQFRIRDGGHTWEYWHSALYISLPFVSRVFSQHNYSH